MPVQCLLDTTKSTEIFIECDDFIKGIEAFLDAQGLPGPGHRVRKRERQMSKSEMMSIIIFYHYSGFRCFKWYYNQIVKKAFAPYFPTLFLMAGSSS